MSVYLKSKAVSSVHRRHPWVFSGALDRVRGNPEDGAIIPVMAHNGEFLAWGQYNSRSRIRIRLLDWDEKTGLDENWWERRLLEAAARRRELAIEPGLTAYRVVFGESDFLPGLIVDYYAGWLVLQASTPGADRVKHSAAEVLGRALAAKGVYERSDTDSRRLEGLTPKAGLLTGAPLPENIAIEEGGHRFLVNVRSGQKTGFFLDQRDNRRIVAAFGAGKKVLDCFSHTAAFSVYAAAGKASSLVRVEASAEAAAQGDENLSLNGFDRWASASLVGDAFKILRSFRDQGRTFDLIILDPPRFAPTRAHVSKAARGYKDINLLAFKLLEPGGLLATFSCSQGLDDGLFQKIVFGASHDAGRPAQIVRRLHQGADHPVLLSFPESWYLKGLICRVD